jgi:hypothetical protein
MLLFIGFPRGKANFTAQQGYEKRFASLFCLHQVI